jgi:hypothetical protein
MGYEDQNTLTQDSTFRGRVKMSVAEQAQIFVNDDRAEYKQLAYQAMAALEPTTEQFVPLVAMRPAMTAESTDLDIMAAVQYVWPLVGARYVPVPVAPPQPI